MIAGFKDFVLLQLDRLPAVTARAMFGGWGLYSAGVFFGIVWRDGLYFRTGPETVEDYAAAGMSPLRPSADMTLKNYYQVPPDVLESGQRLAEWAGKAVEAAAKAGPARKRRPR